MGVGPVTNSDTRGAVIFDALYQKDQTLTPTATTYLPYTILARDSVSGKLVPFVKGGTTNENGIPKALLPYELVSAGTDDLKVNTLIGGRVNKDKLVIDADGDASNIDAVVLEQLRDYGIIGEPVTQNTILDNQ